MKIIHLMLYREIISAFCGNYEKKYILLAECKMFKVKTAAKERSNDHRRIAVGY
jgi:hypothetical protein